MSLLSNCINKKAAFQKYSLQMVLPDNVPFKRANTALLEHPMYCVKHERTHFPIVESLALKYECKVKTIQWLMIYTIYGNIRFIPINIDSNDSWSKSKRHLLEIGDRTVIVRRNTELECYEFEYATEDLIPTPSEKQITKAIEETLIPIIIHEGNVNNFVSLIGEPTDSTNNSSNKEKKHFKKEISNYSSIGKKEETTYSTSPDFMFDIDIDNLDAPLEPLSNDLLK